jgi:uncharacterized protein (TIRG00374 family)
VTAPPLEDPQRAAVPRPPAPAHSTPPADPPDASPDADLDPTPPKDVDPLPPADLDPPPPADSPRRRWLRLVRWAAIVIGLAVFVPLTLRGRVPAPAAIMTAMRGAHLGWVGAAIGLQIVSMAAFAAQQRTLLSGLGVRIGLGRIMAISYARSAISISFPAGAAVSAGYALREFRRAGASADVSTAIMIVSGLLSIGGLAGLYVGGAASVLAQHPGTIVSGPLPLVVAIFLLVAAAVMWSRRRRERRVTSAHSAPPSGRLTGRLASGWATAVNAWHAGASLRARHWTASFLYAAANWLTDLLCLAGATRALGLPIPVTTLAGIYLGVQIVRQIPITPGGVGVIETAFIAGLTAAGSTAASATAAVLIYRLISGWAILPAGGFAAVLLRRYPDVNQPEIR